eukprot:1322167-Pyramimonas_sp.AAC.1
MTRRSALPCGAVTVGGAEAMDMSESAGPNAKSKSIAYFSRSKNIYFPNAVGPVALSWLWRSRSRARCDMADTWPGRASGDRAHSPCRLG